MEAHLRLADTLRVMRRPAESVSHYDSVVEIDPRRVDAMIHMTVALPASEMPSESAVAPGTAIVMWVPAFAASFPLIVCRTEPNTGAIRVPFASMASRSF